MTHEKSACYVLSLVGLFAILVLSCGYIRSVDYVLCVRNARNASHARVR